MLFWEYIRFSFLYNENAAKGVFLTSPVWVNSNDKSKARIYIIPVGTGVSTVRELTITWWLFSLHPRGRWHANA